MCGAFADTSGFQDGVFIVSRPKGGTRLARVIGLKRCRQFANTAYRPNLYLGDPLFHLNIAAPFSARRMLVFRDACIGKRRRLGNRS